MSRMALEARSNAVQVHDRVMETRAWKLFCLLPYLLLRRPLGEQRVSKAELNFKIRRLCGGQIGRVVEADDDQCARESWQINGDEPRDQSQHSMPESPHGRSISSTTVFDRSRIGTRHQGDSCRVAEQAPPGGLRPVPEEVLNCTQSNQ